MKYIFDFDDVISFTTRYRKEFMVPFLEKHGISTEVVSEYYQKARITGFSLKDLLSSLRRDDLYEEIMAPYKDFRNDAVIKVIEKLGKENCFLITHGDEEFQKDKIARAGVIPLFSEIITLVGTKKNAVADIADRYQDEEIFFIDDKSKYFEDIDFSKNPNINTLLYTGQNLENYFQ